MALGRAGMALGRTGMALGRAGMALGRTGMHCAPLALLKASTEGYVSTTSGVLDEAPVARGISSGLT